MSTLFTPILPKNNEILTDSNDFLQIGSSIADFPKSLWYAGTMPATRRPAVAIVGSRKLTPYGKEVTYKFSYELAGHGVVIISGLALGADAVAHQAALDAGGIAIAILPTPLTKIHPATNLRLAERIVVSGGALISEYAPGTPIYKSNFVARNRIVSGLSDGVLITEAAQHSGTTSTANFALDQGKTVMAVPGNITNPMSAGCNNLIKVGATPVTNTEDILHALGMIRPKVRQKVPRANTPQEKTILELIAGGLRGGEELQQKSGLEAALFNQTLTILEITGRIRALGGNQWGL